MNDATITTTIDNKDNCKANAMSVSFNTQNKSLHIGHNVNSMQQTQQNYHKNT